MPKGRRQNQLARSSCHVGAFDTQIKLLVCSFACLSVCLFFQPLSNFFDGLAPKRLQHKLQSKNFLLKHYVISNYLLCLR